MKKFIILAAIISAILPSFSQNAAELDILNSLNEYRAKNGLSAVIYSKELSKSARHHASYLSLCKEKNLYGVGHDEIHRHVNWNSYSFSQRRDLMRKSGYELSAEIQIQNSLDEIDAPGVIQSFHDSPSHREIMRSRSENDKLVGIGFINGCSVIVFGGER
jgi:uncharacterized protein YkwD